MATWYDLAELLFPEVNETIEDLLTKYSSRSETMVLRFAPSPTGFLHLGSLYTTLIGSTYVNQQGGKFLLRIEDTDQKREIQGATSLLIQSLKKFGISFDEGPLGENEQDVGQYGPYVQSKRANLYNVFIKHLIAQGLAYPCRMTEEELNSIREKQTANKQIPGIYGQFSTYRSYSVDELIAKYHQEKDTFAVIRFRSHGDTTKKITFTDEIKGEISMIDNYNDIVILKGDRLPTYHLAHIVDDTLMRISLVTRGDEWLTSVPLHLQLFNAFGLPTPKYAHLAPVCKMDEGKKRKLSKRNDPEANVRFLFEKGYSVEGILEYLMTLANSNFEDRRKEHSDLPLANFSFSMHKMSVAGPLFDETKLQWVNNEYLSKISTEELFTQTLEWAREFQPDFASLLQSDIEYAKAAINIERHTEKDPKRFTLYSNVQQQILFFFDSEREKGEKVRKEILAEHEHFTKLQDFIREYCEVVNLETDEVLIWFNQLKEIGKKYGYAGNNAEFREGGYLGKIGDLAMFLRIQLCNAKQTPDLFSVMKVLGKERVVKRLRSNA